MHDLQLSLIVPSIRPHNWERFCSCVEQSFSGSFEVIFVGPHASPPDNLNRFNIKCIQDFGSPVWCAQRGTCQASGFYTFLSSDDVFFYPHAIDRVFTIFDQYKCDYKFIVTGKYYEGDN